MESKIMLSDTFDHVYKEIDTLIKQKKEDGKRMVLEIGKRVHIINFRGYKK